MADSNTTITDDAAASTLGDSKADGATTSTNNTTAQQRSSSATRQQNPPSNPVTAALRKQPSNSRLPQPQSPSTAGPSPRASRNPSPARKDARPTPPIPSQPSPAAIQRALSASNVPSLATGASASDNPASSTRGPRSAGPASGETTPQWPVSPRLKSPPPSGTRRATATPTMTKKGDGTTNAAPSISVQGPGEASANSSATTSSSTPQPQRQSSLDVSKVDQQLQLQTPSKISSRGPSGKSVLETVQENSSDTTEPSLAAVQAAADLRPLTKIADDDKSTSAATTNADENEKANKVGESESESGGNKSDGRTSRRSSHSQPPRRAKTGYSSLAGSKPRQPEGTRNMTVETETVQSIPHSGLNAGERSASTRGDTNGSVKLKSSNETIRPKKERKQPAKKARSVNQGTASSKADIFEARVASAVDEANSSDSEETFVYESNPPEPRRTRHHSRTPSVTSAHSTAADPRNGLRNLGDVLDDRRVAGKRSMKFSNNPFNDHDSPTDRQDGTVRAHQPRHYGRWGRGGHQTSMFDPDSPFTQASKLRNNPNSTRQSRPNSPRSPQTAQFRSIAPPLFGRKKDSAFDFDAEGADDERTPLISNIRTPRSSRFSTRNTSGSSDAQSIDEYYGVRRRSRCGRLGGFLLGMIVLAIVVLSTVAFLVMSNRPLADVRIHRIQNVLASEQELMMDLMVGAVNPNALSVTVSNMDVNVFAKSKYVDPPSDVVAPVESIRTRTRDQIRGGKDHGTDPPKDGDLDSDAQTMLLGRIFHFDQDLDFEGSPIKWHMHFSTGEVRLAQPGNKTEAGGTKRWEKVLQHPFELIVRGVLRYRLPVSASEETAAVGATVLVHPEDGVDEMGRMRTEPVRHHDYSQLIDWEHELDRLGGIEEELQALSH